MFNICYLNGTAACINNGNNCCTLCFKGFKLLLNNVLCINGYNFIFKGLVLRKSNTTILIIANVCIVLYRAGRPNVNLNNFNNISVLHISIIFPTSTVSVNSNSTNTSSSYSTISINGSNVRIRRYPYSLLVNRSSFNS